MRRLAVLGVLGVLLLAVAWWFFLISPRNNRIAEEQTKLDAAVAKHATLQAELEELQRIDEASVEYQAAISKLEMLIPENPELADLIDEIDELATAAGVDVQSMSPAVPALLADSDLRTISLSLTIDADYYSIIDFLSRIIDSDNSDRLIRVDAIALSSYEDPLGATRLSVSVALRAFTRSDLLPIGEPIPLDGDVIPSDGTDGDGTDETPEAGEPEAT